MTLKTLKKLGHLNFAFFVLPPFMVLLIIGTLAQPWLGLYRAQSALFSSWVIWAGPIPLPGGMVLLGLITLSLLFKFLFYSTWRWSKTGIILSHLGVLVLLIGGLFTQITAKEGFMMLPEGQSSGYVYDYTVRSLFIFKNETLHEDINFKDLSGSLDLDLPFKINILNTCANCLIEAQTDDDPALEGMAKNMRLVAKPQEKEPERNFSGLSAAINGKRYVLFENMPAPIEITDDNGDNYKLIFGKQQRALPFTITLKNFAKKTYPNSPKAQNYYSDIIINDGTRWPVRVEMNKPLRYKGYTFFQSSFSQTDDVNASVLAVVENRTYPFPYIGTALLALGLLIHCGFMMRERLP